MAIIKASKGGKTLSRAINYAAKDDIVSGINCPDDPRLACEQMNSTKEVWGKEDGRLYKPYVQSFAPGEVTSDQAHQVGREFAEKAFPGYEIIVGTHTESKSGVIHNHFVINSVNFEDGHKIQTDKKDLERFKLISDEICLKHGLSIVDRDKPREKGTVVAWDRDKYQIIAKALEGKGKSHLVDIAQAVSKALVESQGKGMKVFQDNLKEQGITYYERSDKGITFVTSDNKKATGATLAKTFTNDDFTKANILAIANQKEIPPPEPKKNIEPVTNYHEYVYKKLEKKYSAEGYKKEDLDKKIYLDMARNFKPENVRKAITLYSHSIPDESGKAKLYLDKIAKDVDKSYNDIKAGKVKFSGGIELDRGGSSKFRPPNLTDHMLKDFLDARGAVGVRANIYRDEDDEKFKELLAQGVDPDFN